MTTKKTTTDAATPQDAGVEANAVAARVRGLYEADGSTEDLADVESGLTSLFNVLLYAGGPLAPGLADELYRLALRRWQERRALGPDAWAAGDEENMSSHHGYLLEAIERAERDAAEKGGVK